MKTRKQVLAEFQRMHRQLCGTINGFVDTREYKQGSRYWTISLFITEFADSEIVAKHEVAWRNYCDTHTAGDERENEAVLAEFKEKFNLK